MNTKIKLDNLEFIFHVIKTYKKVNAEEFVLDLYKKLGEEIVYSRKEFEFEPGMPDLYIKNKHFIEVKTNGDGLKYEQLEWIKNNPGQKVVVFYLKQLTEEKKVNKIKKEAIKKEAELGELKTLSNEMEGLL